MKHYRSIEIFGDDDGAPDPADAEIRLACANWVGRECPAAENSCDADDFSYQSLTEGCWVMASEDDVVNECGQATVEDGTVISLTKYTGLNGGVTYLSADDNPMNLFLWKWKSTPEYGSLICSKGFWYGCKEANEGKEFPELINNQKYKCAGSEWVKQ